MSKCRLLAWGALTIAVLLGGAWAFGEIAYSRKSPAQRNSGVILSREAEEILRRACFDCHSNETRYPWYARLPVVSIVMSEHVRRGRAEFF